MREIRNLSRAAKDLTEIWLYSYQQWDEQQAGRYFDQLDEGVQSLARNPHLGKPIDDIRPGYRALHVRRHAVFYTISDSAIHIVRVLHERMLPGEHL